MSEAPHSRLLSVWLIEDHQTYGERLMRALNRLEGIRCTQRFSACEDALAALPQSALPQVILLDVELPGINGLDAIAPLRAGAPQAAIVILTVFEDDEKIFRAICAGAAGYLLKTSTTEEIADALRIAAREVTVEELGSAVAQGISSGLPSLLVVKASYVPPPNTSPRWYRAHTP